MQYDIHLLAISSPLMGVSETLRDSNPVHQVTHISKTNRALMSFTHCNIHIYHIQHCTIPLVTTFSTVPTLWLPHSALYHPFGYHIECYTFPLVTTLSCVPSLWLPHWVVYLPLVTTLSGVPSLWLPHWVVYLPFGCHIEWCTFPLVTTLSAIPSLWLPHLVLYFPLVTTFSTVPSLWLPHSALYHPLVYHIQNCTIPMFYPFHFEPCPCLSHSALSHICLTKSVLSICCLPHYILHHPDVSHIPYCTTSLLSRCCLPHYMLHHPIVYLIQYCTTQLFISFSTAPSPCVPSVDDVPDKCY